MSVSAGIGPGLPGSEALAHRTLAMISKLFARGVSDHAKGQGGGQEETEFCSFYFRSC